LGGRITLFYEIHWKRLFKVESPAHQHAAIGEKKTSRCPACRSATSLPKAMRSVYFGTAFPVEEMYFPTFTFKRYVLMFQV